MNNQPEFPARSSKNALVDLIQKTFLAALTSPQMAEVFLLDTWVTDEGVLVDGITFEGLIYQGDGLMPRVDYTFSQFSEHTLKETLNLLQEEAFT